MRERPLFERGAAVSFFSVPVRSRTRISRADPGPPTITRLDRTDRPGEKVGRDCESEEGEREHNAGESGAALHLLRLWLSRQLPYGALVLTASSRTCFRS